MTWWLKCQKVSLVIAAFAKRIKNNFGTWHRQWEFFLTSLNLKLVHTDFSIWSHHVLSSFVSSRFLSQLKYSFFASCFVSQRLLFSSRFVLTPKKYSRPLLTLHIKRNNSPEWLDSKKVAKKRLGVKKEDFVREEKVENVFIFFCHHGYFLGGNWYATAQLLE